MTCYKCEVQAPSDKPLSVLANHFVCFNLKTCDGKFSVFHYLMEVLALRTVRHFKYKQKSPLQLKLKKPNHYYQ